MNKQYKAFLVEEESGDSYGTVVVTNVFLVPYDFKYDLDRKTGLSADYINFLVEIKKSGKIKLNKDGHINGKEVSKLHNLYIEYLRERFEEIEFIQ